MIASEGVAQLSDYVVSNNAKYWMLCSNIQRHMNSGNDGYNDDGDWWRWLRQWWGWWWWWRRQQTGQGEDNFVDRAKCYGRAHLVITAVDDNGNCQLLQHQFFSSRSCWNPCRWKWTSGKCSRCLTEICICHNVHSDKQYRDLGNFLSDSFHFLFYF